MTPTVCLVMIVKNESRVIGRCITALRQAVDEAVIVDTGSTDNTLEATQAAWLAGGRGGALHLYRSDWVDFATNRTEALRIAADVSECDFLLVIDADEVLAIPPGARLEFDGSADLYSLRVAYGGLAYTRACVMRRTVPWYYRWPVHEALMPPEGWTGESGGVIEGCVVLPTPDGARSADPGKYRRDAEQLSQWVAKYPDDARATYYLAQSYRDAGRHNTARHFYARRALMGGWQEEVFSSLLEAAKCGERTLTAEPTDREVSEVLDAYLEAHAARPTRAEALFHAMRMCLERGQPALADSLAPAWRAIPLPVSDVLFVERNAYASGPAT